MKKIIIAKGKQYKMLYDKEDQSVIDGHTWHILQTGTGYVRTNVKVNGKFKGLLLHRLLMGVDGTPEIVIDHKNHNTLDNRRENLRRCSQRENQRNRLPKGESKYLGVAFQRSKYKTKTYKSIISVIRIDGQHRYLGSFKTEEQAARAYDIAAINHYGREFSNLNFPNV